MIKAKTCSDLSTIKAVTTRMMMPASEQDAAMMAVVFGLLGTPAIYIIVSFYYCASFGGLCINIIKIRLLPYALSWSTDETIRLFK